jgi:hypothetical protein
LIGVSVWLFVWLVFLAARRWTQFKDVLRVRTSKK